MQIPSTMRMEFEYIGHKKGENIKFIVTLRIPSCGTRRCLDQVRNEVSEERVPSIFRMERIRERGEMLAICYFLFAKQMIFSEDITEYLKRIKPFELV
jgi:hypothetical protein